MSTFVISDDSHRCIAKIMYGKTFQKVELGPQHAFSESYRALPLSSHLGSFEPSVSALFAEAMFSYDHTHRLSVWEPVTLLVIVTSSFHFLEALKRKYT